MKRVLWIAVLLFAAATSIVASSGALAHEGREVGEYELVVGFINEPAYEGEPNGVELRIVHVGDHAASTSATPDHGELINATIPAGGTFEYTPEHDLEGVPFTVHVHPMDFMSTVAVSHDAPADAVVTVEIGESGFSTDTISVRAGNTIRFESKLTESITLMTDETGAAAEPAAVTGIASGISVVVTHVSTGQSKTFPFNESFSTPGTYLAHFVPTAPGAYRFQISGDIEGTAFDEVFESGPGTFSEIAPASEAQFPTLTGSLREVDGAARSAQTAASEAEDSASSAKSMAIAGLIMGALAFATSVAWIAVSVARKSGVRK